METWNARTPAAAANVPKAHSWAFRLAAKISHATKRNAHALTPQKAVFTLDKMRYCRKRNVLAHQRAKLSEDLQITARRRMAGRIATSKGALVLRIVANATAAK